MGMNQTKNDIDQWTLDMRPTMLVAAFNIINSSSRAWEINTHPRCAPDAWNPKDGVSLQKFLPGAHFNCRAPTCNLLLTFVNRAWCGKIAAWRTTCPPAPKLRMLEAIQKNARCSHSGLWLKRCLRMPRTLTRGRATGCRLQKTL